MTKAPQSWRKATRSSNTNSCVEVANTLGAIRDSKNVDAPVLAVDVATLVVVVKDGRFDS